MQQRRGGHGPDCRHGGWPALVAGIFFLLVPKPAAAEGIKGIVNWNYSRLDTATKDVNGIDSHEQLRSFVQLYSLTMDKNILPLLKLSAGGTFQKNDADIITGDTRNTSTTTLTRPRVDLTLTSQVLSMGAGFSRVAADSTTSGVRAPTLLSDAYHGFLGWKPSELPTVDVMVTSTNNYDQDRAFQDVTTNQVSLFSRYEPAKGFQLQYKGSSVDTRDHLSDLETKVVSNGGRITYTDQFLKNRILFSSYYDVSHSSIETIAGRGTGLVKAPVLAFDGFFAISNLPVNDPLHPMVSTPFLIDNEVTGTNANAVNIGSAPFIVSPPQDTSPRNIGLRFGTVMELNNLVIYVYSVSNTGVPTYLNSSPTGLIPSLFQWDVYTSTDNLTWSFFQTINAAPYEPIAALPGVGRFELSLPVVNTQYIKVVVRPLDPARSIDALLFPVIAVTELQAFMQRPASEVQGKRSGMLQTLTLYTKVNLLDDPNLFYDFSYLLFEASSGGSTVRRSSMSNGLSMFHRFNQAVSGVMRAERVDAHEPVAAGNTVTYNYSASVQAVPLPTLRHSLAYGLSIHETPTGRSNTNSLYVTNNADIYRNIIAFFNAGWSLGVQETDQKTKTSDYSYGISLAPKKSLTMTLSATDLVTSQTGGGLAEHTTVSRRQDGNVAYMPFSTLYLTAGISRIAQSTLHDTMQNYGINWSPFPGGALQFNFSYSESLSNRDNAIVKITQPSVRWTISRWASVDASYFSSDSVSDRGRILTKGTSVNFNSIF